MTIAQDKKAAKEAAALEAALEAAALQAAEQEAFEEELEATSLAANLEEGIEAPEVVRLPGQVQVSDFQLLTGALVQRGNDGRIYDTAKGRLIKQIYKDVAFTAVRAYNANAARADVPVADTQSAKLLALEESTSPYKEGIDASPVDPVVINPLATHRPRTDLLFDILHHVDQDDAIATEKAAIVKQQAVIEQASYIAGREKKTSPLAIRSVQRRIAEGLACLKADDGEYDALFLTAAATFVTDYPNKFMTDEDAANIGIVQAALDFTGEKAELSQPAKEIVFEI